MPPGANLEIPRDGYGRPKIIPPDGGKPVAYTRMSTISKTVKDSGMLANWKSRMAVVGLAQRPALMTKLVGLLASSDPDHYKTKRAIDSIVEDALAVAGAGDKADIGTGIHGLTEAADGFGDKAILKKAPKDVLARVAEYTAAVEGYEPLLAEGFVVVDEIRAAGSFDRLWRCPDGKVRVGDLKTGAWDAKDPLGVSAQLAGYAKGKFYDPTTGERTDLHPDLDVHEGLLISLPPDGGCEVIPIDLDLGWAVLMTAVKVHALRKIRAAEFRAV